MSTRQLDQAYVANTYGRFDVALSRASGATYWDEEGKEYIDLGSGIAVTCFGACDPEWIAAVTAQMTTLGHTSNLYYTSPQVKLAEELCRRTGMKKVFFGNSGAEANECALKVARKYGNDHYADKRPVIITLKNSFHGRTIATLAATGQDVFHRNFGPFPEGFRYVAANDKAELDAALAPGDVCGMLIETVQGEGGVVSLDKDYVQYAWEKCRERDVLFMIDEVQTGNGRTGTLYSYMQFGVEPDVVTTAKGLAGGLPMGACILGEKAEAVLGRGDHGSTFGGNPICAAGALNVLSRIDDALLAGVKEREALIRSELEGVPGCKGVSGMGLMLGIAVEKPAGEIAAACLRDGLMVLTAHEKVRLLPPLNIDLDTLKRGLAILKKHL